MSHSSTQLYFQEFKQAKESLQVFFSESLTTLQIQKLIYQQFIIIFSKFSKKLTTLSHRINQEILKTHTDEASVNTYQFLSNCLLRMAQCSRKVANKGRNQVFDPLQVFGKNYQHVCQDMLNKFSGFLSMIAKSEANLTKSRQNYIASAERLQKHRQLQTKMLSRIQKGDFAQLQKFNAQMRRITQAIDQNEKNYKSCVQRINNQWQQTKMHVNSISVSMQYNEQSRISFTRRSVQSSIKLLEQFNNAFDSSCTQKLQESNTRMLQSQDKISSVDKRLLTKIGLLISCPVSEQFISYEQMCRRKKKTLLQQQSNHLQQIFSKVSENDKQIMKEIIRPWFQQTESKQKYISDSTAMGFKQSLKKQNVNSSLTQKSKSLKNLQKSNGNHEKSSQKIQSRLQDKTKKNQEKSVSSPQKIKPCLSDDRSPPIPVSQTLKNNSKTEKQEMIHSISPTLRKANSTEMQIDACKEKILSVQPYSFYFIEILYQSIAQMSSFYCKVQEEDFFLLLNFFSTISKNANIGSETGVQLLYKMIQISQRITKKKSPSLNNGKGQPIELLCYLYGKSLSCLYEFKNIKCLLNYLQKRKGLKKKIMEPGKNVMMGFAKSFFSTMTRKKQSTAPNLNEDQRFNCLQQLTNIMANLSLPNQVSLPFLKKQLQNSQSTYDYLKGIILAKRDQQQRHRLVYKKELKQKRQLKMKKLIENKGVAAYVLALTAKHGFLDKNNLSMRLVCRSLRSINLEILHNLKIPIRQKWPLLISFNRSSSQKYMQMKKQVAENSVPSAVQEIITLDVNRSLHLHGDYFNPTLLHSLLRVYAYYHNDISYCQGMNYIAGYIYIKTLNQEPAYRIFERVMETRFKELFLNEFRMLKQKMYQFQRVLSIFHPQIAEHFKRQSISPECYIVSWMITLFASTYQYTMSSYVVDVLWERFLIYGWRQFFKFVLWLFSYHKDDLLEMTYDKVLHRLGQVMRSELFIASEEVFKKEFAEINLEYEINRYEVTDQMLDGFIKQYKLN